MSNLPSVSILMPVFNAATFLQESINSLLEQKLSNIEIICVNDGSTDNSLAMLRSYATKDSRVRIIDQPNSGYGRAMNVGLKAAVGKYIGILEPDDFADTDMFEKLYLIAEENEADLVKSNYWAYKTADQSNTFVEPLCEKKYGSVTSSKEDPRIVIGPACIWSAIYRRDMLMENNISFTETPGASYQDTAFAFKALVCAKRVVFIKDAYLHYRTDNENSSVNSKGKIFSICDEFQAIQAFLNQDTARRKTFSPVLQVHKLRVYGWNLRRIAPDFKETFRTQMALDFIKAEYDGFLRRDDFTEHEWELLQNHMEYHRNSPSKKELSSIKNSVSFRLGRAITYLPRMVRDLLK